MTIELLDIVEVMKDLPKQNIKMGMRGTVIEVFTRPNLAYEVEFSDKMGRTIAQAALLPSQIKKLVNITREEFRNSKPY